MLLRPQPDDPVIHREGLNPFQEHRAHGVGDRKVRERLTVNARLPFDDLKSQRTYDFTSRTLDHLKFGQSPFEIADWIAH
jgi:hypothetical protein